MGLFGNIFAKINGKSSQLEGTREQLYPLAVRIWAPGREPLGGLVQPPLRIN